MKKTLNVGAGERTFTNYPNKEYECTNLDERNLKGIDIIGDVRDLSMFKDEEFDHILCSDILEHFPISETNEILTEWKRVLKVGGIMEFRAPDLRTICKSYIDGKNDAKMTSWLLYGGQTYPGNFHYVGFDKNWLSKILKQNGLEPFDVKTAGNNFEIKAKKK